MNARHRLAAAGLMALGTSAALLPAARAQTMGEPMTDPVVNEPPADAITPQVPSESDRTQDTGRVVATEPAEKSALSLSLGVDSTSHFISYGADVWGGGYEVSPYSSRSTTFAYGTASLALTDNLSAFANLWSDLNNNVDSSIGGPIQEIDFNTGLTLALGDFSITGAHGFWNYAGEVEKVIDLTLAYSGTNYMPMGFALNPAITAHWRYDGNNGQKAGVALVPSLAPSFTFFDKGDYPLTVTVPLAVGIFTSSGFQGGDSGYGYFSAGLTGSIPLAFIPKKYGEWSFSAGVTYYNTPSAAIPGNPEQNFFVSALSIGASF